MTNEQIEQKLASAMSRARAAGYELKRATFGATFEFTGGGASVAIPFLRWDGDDLEAALKELSAEPGQWVSDDDGKGCLCALGALFITEQPPPAQFMSPEIFVEVTDPSSRPLGSGEYGMAEPSEEGFMFAVASKLLDRTHDWVTDFVNGFDSKLSHRQEHRCNNMDAYDMGARLSDQFCGEADA